MKDIFFSKYSFRITYIFLLIFPKSWMEEGQTLSTGRIELWRNSITIDNRLDRAGGGLSFPVSVQLLGERIAAEAVSAS